MLRRSFRWNRDEPCIMLFVVWLLLSSLPDSRVGEIALNVDSANIAGLRPVLILPFLK